MSCCSDNGCSGAKAHGHGHGHGGHGNHAAPATNKVNEFVTQLVGRAGTLVPGGVQLPSNGTPFDPATQKLTLIVAGQPRHLHVPTLFSDWNKCSSAAARDAFIDATIASHLNPNTGPAAAASPQAALASFSAAKSKLMPLLATATWEAQQRSVKAIAPGDKLPRCSLESGASGEWGALGLGVVLVLDFGTGFMPVSDKLLLNWEGQLKAMKRGEGKAFSWVPGAQGTAFDSAMQVALENLGKRDMAREWTAHQTRCRISAWHDGFDATRVALLPQHLPAQEDGDHVAVFASANQVLLAGARNPLSLCFMGDTVTHDVPADLKLHGSPLRLVKESSSSSSSSSVLGTKCRWVPYEPRVGEFVVPTSRSQCDAVLSAFQSKKPVPLFERERAEALRQAGNAAFKQKDWVTAVGKYSKAAALVPKDPAPLSNRCFALLKMNRFDAAKADAQRVLALEPGHEKATFRLGLAEQGLGHWAAASAIFQGALRKAEAPGASEVATGAKKLAAKHLATTKELEATAVRALEATAAAGLSLMRTAVPKKGTTGREPSALGVRVKKLAARALGWAPGTKSSGAGGGEAAPGWMPVGLIDTPGARLAAMELYALVRSADATSEDAATAPPSAYTQEQPTLAVPDDSLRREVIKQLAAIRAERGLVLVNLAAAAGQQSSPSTASAPTTPLERRTLPELLASLGRVAELRRIERGFASAVAEGDAFSQLIASGALAIAPLNEYALAKAQRAAEAKAAKVAARAAKKAAAEAKRAAKRAAAAAAASSKAESKTAASSSSSSSPSSSMEQAAPTMSVDPSTLSSLNMAAFTAAGTAGGTLGSTVQLPGLGSLNLGGTSTAGLGLGGESGLLGGGMGMGMPPAAALPELDSIFAGLDPEHGQFSDPSFADMD